MKFSARTQMIAALAVSAVLVGSTAAWGSQVYLQTSQSAQGQTQQLIAAGKEHIKSLNERSADLELAITNATTILNDSSGKVLDESTRASLEKSIAAAQETLAAQKKKLRQLSSQVTSLKSTDIWESLLPTLKLDRAENTVVIDKKQIETIANNVIALGQGIQQVQSAQAAWQAEQDRIAAEKAAAEAAAAAQAAAAARRAAQAKTLEQTGGSTTPTAPAPPVTAAAAAPVTPSFSAEAYITALAPNAYVVWDNGMCARQFGPNVYLCGFATVNLNGSNTDRVPITLDSALTERYSNSVGVSVLVHEAAHARQWWKYGPAIMTAYNALVPNQTGSMPVEWMADCATIVKLGYSTGAYTRSCTPEQLAEAATLW